MKRGFFTLAFFTSVLAISCSKDDAELGPEPEQAAGITAGNFVSNWETAPSWQSSSSNGITTYFFKRSTPQLTKAAAAGKALVVWTKGYDFEGMTKGDKPLGLPFTWIPSNERYMHPYTWYYQGTENMVSVGVDMHDEMAPVFNQSRDGIKMRYFVLSDEFMKANGLTGPTLHSLSYDKLIAMLNVTP
jgi:hypothetical protein